MITIKSWLQKHKRLRKLIRSILRRNIKIPIFSYEDINLMVDDWCKFLPRNFDCIIGIPRGGLIVAAQIALNFGLPLSTPDDFKRGIYWQSDRLRISPTFKRILIVDDCVDTGNELIVEKAYLQNFFPYTDFKIASLVLVGKCRVDYCYVVEKSFISYGDLPKYKHGILRARVMFGDIT